MKALTVQPPWSWAIICGGKDVENRTGRWKYRGLLAIHAGARLSDRGLQHPLVRAQWQAQGLRTRYARDHSREHSLAWVDVPDRELLTMGALIGLVELVDSHPAGPNCCTSPWAEREYEEHGGRVRRDLQHLVLVEPRRFLTPVPMRGRLGLWDLPEGSDVNGMPWEWGHGPTVPASGVPEATAAATPHPSYTEEAPRGR